MTYDHFELRIALVEPNVGSVFDSCSHLISQSVHINGRNIAPDHPVDLLELAKSCQLSGDYAIVTCGCGVADCAGIYDGIRVRHFPDRITWEIPDPLTYRGLSSEDQDKQQENRRYLTFSFEPCAYLEAVKDGLRKARALLFSEKQPIECTPHGFTQTDLLELDPEVFSERGAPQGCHLIAKRIEIDTAPGWLRINRISYRLSQLPLPDEIKNLDDWSAWEPKPCGNGYAYNYAAAPSWELRRRLKKLGNYLAEVTRTGGEIVITMREDWTHHRSHVLIFDGRARSAKPSY